MSLHDRAEAALLPTYPERPLALVRGAGCTVWDEDGNAYLDLVAGLAVCSLGHGHPAAVQALAAAGGRARARLEPLLQRADGRARRAPLRALRA